MELRKTVIINVSLVGLTEIGIFKSALSNFIHMINEEHKDDTVMIEQRDLAQQILDALMKS